MVPVIYFHHQLSSGVSKQDKPCSFSHNIFLTSLIIIVKNKLLNYKTHKKEDTGSQALGQIEHIREADLAVFGLVLWAWHAGLAQRAGWVWEVIPSRAVGAANIRGGEVCVPQVLSILTLGTW